MSEALLISIVSGLVELLKDVESAPSEAQIEKTVRDAMVKAADAEIVAEFPGG